jgi:hypothetical protein
MKDARPPDAYLSQAPRSTSGVLWCTPRSAGLGGCTGSQIESFKKKSFRLGCMVQYLNFLYFKMGTKI